jgi:peptide/nickel transport system permease protein
MYVVNTKLSLPGILLAIALVALIGGSTLTVAIVLGFLLWDRYAVVVRSATQQARSNDYVAAAEAVGASRLRITVIEVLPNVMNQIIVVATLEMALAILAEAALSFLGLGVPPPTPSWGLMISEGRNFMFFKPYLIMIPGTALFILVMAINLLGDGIRDITAPEGLN